jgi:hypothetical protein
VRALPLVSRGITMKMLKMKNAVKWSYFIVFLILTFILINPNRGIASDEFNFAKAVIRSFQCNLIAREKTMANDNQKTDNYFTRFFSTMNVKRMAISWHEKAILEIQPYYDNKSDSINTTTKAISTGNNIIINVLKEDILLIEQMLNKKPEELQSEMGSFLNKLSEHNELANKGWELLMMGAIGVCHSLVYKQGTLAVTAIERKELLKELRSIGIRSGAKAGQKPIDAAPSIIWGFLNEKGWKTIDSIPLQ